MLGMDCVRKDIDEEPSLKQEFLNLCDEFSEFNDYCAFFCESVSLHTNQCEMADKIYAQGLKRFSRSVRDRAQFFDEWLQRINEKI